MATSATSAARSDPPPARDWGYRPALDGLRAVAVYLVVAYHAGVDRFRAGHVGVDVFFVLSGFLVTNVLLTEHAREGRIRLARFYARRARRLLPAALVAIVGTATLSLLFVDRLTRAGYTGDAQAALLYVANWHAWSSATDYFDEGIAHSPYLHFWSLAVEEQFYAAFPLVLIGLLAVGRRWNRPATAVAVGLGLATVASLAVQIALAGRDPLRAYYGTDARVYQILAGALLALGLRRAGPAVSGVRPVVGASLGAVGLAALVALATGLTPLATSTRGMAAAAASVVLVAGVELAPGALPARLLGVAQVRYLGRISYATYLWHWPFTVFALIVIDASPVVVALLVGVAATATAALSDQLVERPMRDGAILRHRPATVVGCGLALSAVTAWVVVPDVLDRPVRPVVPAQAATGGPILAAGDAPDAATSAALSAAPPVEIDLGPTEPPPFDRGECAGATPAGCVLATGPGLHVHLIGDSNMQVLVPAFLALADAHGLTVSATTWPGCPWQLDLGWDDPTPDKVADCAAHRREWYDQILPALGPDLVVIANIARDESPGANAPYARTDGQPASAADVAAATAASLDRLTTLGGQTPVVLLEPLPYGEVEPNNCLAAAVTVGECAYRAPAEPSSTERIYRDEDARRGDVVSLDYDRIACPYLPVCAPAVDGQLVFRNRNHLSNAWVVPRAGELWQQIAASGLP